MRSAEPEIGFVDAAGGTDEDSVESLLGCGCSCCVFCLLFATFTAEVDDTDTEVDTAGCLGVAVVAAAVGCCAGGSTAALFFGCGCCTNCSV